MKIRLMLILLLIIVLLSACASPSPESGPEEMLEQIGQALPDGYEKQSVTEVFDLTYTDSSGQTMVYYFCSTTYHAGYPGSVTGLDTDAVSAVFDLEDAFLQLELDIQGYPAAVYALDGCHYLCCTSSPESTLILKYNPDSVSQDDAVKTIRSAFES